METLTLHFDFSKDRCTGDPDMSRFRHELSISLEKALGDRKNGRWRGGRYARGVVTLFLEVPDARAALERIAHVLDARGLTRRLTIGHGSSDHSA
jgi:hypothetical protein